MQRLNTDRPTCVITGASSGIGLALARALIAARWSVHGTWRTDLSGEPAFADLGSAFTPHLCDVADPASLHRVAAAVEASLGGRALAGLICNAGVSIPGPLLLQPLGEIETQWRVNALGAVASVQAFAPLLGARAGFTGEPGRIVMISSVSGGVAWPFVGGYAMSKFALEAASDALRRELTPFGIRLALVSPGPIATPLWAKAEAAVDRTRYADGPYGEAFGRFEALAKARAEKALSTDAVVAAVRRALHDRRPKARYPVVGNRLIDWTLPRVLPARLLDAIVTRLMGLTLR